MHEAKRATFNILHKIPDGEQITGGELERRVREKTGESHYTGTILRYMREYRRSTGREVICVSRAKSLYMMGAAK